MGTGTVADSNLGKRQNAKLASNLSINAYSIYMFTAMTREDWLQTVQRVLGAYFFMGINVGLVIVKAALYLYDLIHSRNKNIGKVASFLRELISTTLVVTAILGGLLASVAIGVAAPWLFIANLIVNATYSLSLALYNGICFLREKDVNARELYKTNCKKYAMSTLIVSIATVSTAFLLMLQFAPAVFCIINASLNGIGLLMGVVAAIGQIKSEPKEKVVLKSNPYAELASEAQEKQFNVTVEKKEDLTTAFLPAKAEKGYFSNQNRAVTLFKQDHQREYLLAEIELKMQWLYQQMSQDRGKFFSQEKKRWVKVMTLLKLKTLLQDPAKTEADFQQLLKEPEFNRVFNNPFQSFYRQKGDTQDIFEAAEAFYGYSNEVSHNRLARVMF